jgi:hypothetical protein
MSPRTRLEQEREGRIARDIDPVDRIHLDGDVQGHRNPPRPARRNPPPAHGTWPGGFVKGAGGFGRGPTAGIAAPRIPPSPLPRFHSGDCRRWYDSGRAACPPNTDFVLFNIQVPNAPFGLAWYNGDIVTEDWHRRH